MRTVAYLFSIVLLLSILVFFFLFTSILFRGCSNSDPVFYIPDVGIYVAVSKRWGGKSYIMFSEKDGIATLSDSIDYLEFETTSEMNIIFNPKNKQEINIIYRFGGKFIKTNQVKYKITLYENGEDVKAAIHKYIDVENYPKGREPYKIMSIDTRYYSVNFEGEIFKEGNIGGN